jgi:hypothetical protein
LAFSKNISENRPYHLPFLIIISIVSHFPFVLKGFGEIDATKIAVSVIDMMNNGPGAAFANFYFSDVIPLYIVYLKWSMGLLDYEYSNLPLVMNYTSAVIGTLTVIPAYYLIRKLFLNPAIAFYTVLALIFAPSFYQATIMGFPHLIAFFFILVSFCFFLSGLECEQPSYLRMFLSCLFLTIAFLFKSDILLVSGALFGFVLFKKKANMRNISGAFLIILISGVLFLLLRNMILGTASGGGTTMSQEGLAEWYEYSLIIPNNLTYLIRQTKPIVFGAGVVTFFLGIVSLLYFAFRKRIDVLYFVLPWAAVPVFFWLVMIGNNARHNMTATLPVLAMIVFFFHEKVPRLTGVLTAALILGNFVLTAPSYSILTPSGNLFKSNVLIEERMEIFHSRAKEIANIEGERIVVLGTFHNPHVVFEIMRSNPDYKAVKLNREDYRITAGDREFVFIYFVARNPEEIKESVRNVLGRYPLSEHVFVSAAYDLEPLREMGLRTRPLEIIERAGL